MQFVFDDHEGVMAHKGLMERHARWSMTIPIPCVSIRQWMAKSYWGFPRTRERSKFAASSRSLRFRHEGACSPLPGIKRQASCLTRKRKLQCVNFTALLIAAVVTLLQAHKASFCTKYTRDSSEGRIEAGKAIFMGMTISTAAIDQWLFARDRQCWKDERAGADIEFVADQG